MPSANFNSIKRAITSETIFLVNTYITDITPLKILTSLKKLWLCKNGIRNIDNIHLFKNLENLSIVSNTFSSLYKLKYLDKLNVLCIRDTDTIVDISPIKELVNLSVLILSNNKIRNIIDLKKLVNLEELALERNKITDITILNQFKKLKKLTLRNNMISDITPLLGLVNLEELDLGCNKISRI